MVVVPRVTGEQVAPAATPAVRANPGVAGQIASAAGRLGAGIGAIGGAIQKAEDEERDAVDTASSQAYLTAIQARARIIRRGNGSDNPGLLGQSDDEILASIDTTRSDFDSEVDESFSQLSPGAQQRAIARRDTIRERFHDDLTDAAYAASERKKVDAFNAFKDVSQADVIDAHTDPRASAHTFLLDTEYDAMVEQFAASNRIEGDSVEEQREAFRTSTIGSDYVEGIIRAVAEANPLAADGLREHAEQMGYLTARDIASLRARTQTAAAAARAEQLATSALGEIIGETGGVGVERVAEGDPESPFVPPTTRVVRVTETSLTSQLSASLDKMNLSAPEKAAAMKAAKPAIENMAAMHKEQVEELYGEARLAVRNGFTALEQIQTEDVWDVLDPDQKEALTSLRDSQVKEQRTADQEVIMSGLLLMTPARLRRVHDLGDYDRIFNGLPSAQIENLKRYHSGTGDREDALAEGRRLTGVSTTPGKEKPEQRAIENARWGALHSWIMRRSEADGPPSIAEVGDRYDQLVLSNLTEVAKLSAENLIYEGPHAHLSQDDILATITVLAESGEVDLHQIDIKHDRNFAIRGAFRELVREGRLIGGNTTEDSFDPDDLLPTMFSNDDVSRTPLGHLPTTGRDILEQILREGRDVRDADVVAAPPRRIEVTRNLGPFLLGPDSR